MEIVLLVRIRVGLTNVGPFQFRPKPHRITTRDSAASPFIFKTSIFSTLSCRVRRFSDMRLLCISMNTTHSECKPSSSITHSLQVFLPLPTHLTPATTTILQADGDTQSVERKNYGDDWPNHLHSYAPHAQTTSI